MDVTQLSKTYNVRCLQEDDIEQICTLCSGNPQYYRYHPPAVTADSIREDMRALPPGREPQDKYYVGYFAGNDTLLDVMDLILGYPQEKTALIGFFMVSAARQGTGLGSVRWLAKQAHICARRAIQHCGWAWTRGTRRASHSGQRTGLRRWARGSTSSWSARYRKYRISKRRSNILV